MCLPITGCTFKIIITLFLNGSDGYKHKRWELMMYCSICGKQANDEAIVCTQCGCSLYSIPQGKAKYCSHCGSEVNPEAIVCMSCGCAIYSTINKTGKGLWQNTTTNSPQELVDTITQRIHINGIIWIVIAVIQILVGISFRWGVLIVGILNLFSALSDLKFSKNYSTKPVGLINRVKPIVGAIIVLVYNLLIGGVIGVAGSIYYLVGVRQYVLENESVFQDIEEKYIG